MKANTMAEAAGKPSTLQTLLSTLTIVIGCVLMVGKIYADSEPGAIPLLLIVLGIGWLLVTRVRMRPHDK